MNVRFEYLYRATHGHNYWGEVVFANPNNIALGGIIAAAQDALVARCYFLPSALGLPCLRPACAAGQGGAGDSCWHEAHSFTGSHEQATDHGRRTIEVFIASLERSCRLARPATRVHGGYTG